MYQQTFFFHAEIFPTITLLRNIRKLTEGTFLGQDDMKKTLIQLAKVKRLTGLP